MLTRSQSFPARAPIPRTYKKLIFYKEPDYSLVFKDEIPETKRVNKQLCFLVDTLEGNEWWSIDEFVEYNLFTNETVCDWVNYKNEQAKIFPNTKRRCFMCNRFATKGKTLCNRCINDKHCDLYIYG